MMNFSLASLNRTNNQSVQSRVTFGQNFSKKPASYYEGLTLEDVNENITHPRYSEILNEPWMRKIDGIAMKFEYAELQFTNEGWRDVETKWDMPPKSRNDLTSHSVVIGFDDKLSLSEDKLKELVLNKTGILLGAILGNIATASIPFDLESMKKLVLMEEVEVIEHSRPGGFV